MIILKLLATIIIMVLFLTILTVVLAMPIKAIQKWIENSKLFEVLLKITLIILLVVAVIYLLMLVAAGLWSIWT